ncbi:MAG: hypothetical protein RLP44_02240 [Aggregatilineales bacterium]
MRKIVFLTLTLLIFISALIVFVLMQQTSLKTEFECLDTRNSQTTPDELSRQLDLPVVTFSQLPNEFVNDPQVKLYVWYPIETPECGLRISYFSTDDAVHPSIEIRVTRSSLDNIGVNEWGCLNYNLEPNSNVNLQSVCSNTLQEEDFTIFVSIATRYDKDRTLQIIEDYPLEITIFE